MASLQRVPTPGPGGTAWGTFLASAVGLFLVLAVLKPWGGEPAPAAPPAPATPVRADTTAAPTRAPGPHYRPNLLGRFPPAPAWEVWPTGWVVHFGFSGPLAIVPQHPSTLADLASGAVPLGPADQLVALGINRPAGVPLRDIRLWRFPDGRPPLRLPLVRLELPWQVDTFEVVGLRRHLAEDDIAGWPPGLYRLDLLSEDAGRPAVLAVPLHVAEDPSAGRQPPIRVGPSGPGWTFTPAGLLAAEPGTDLLTYGPDGLISRAVTAARERCSAAQIWQASLARPSVPSEAPLAACLPVSVRRVFAVGTDLAGGEVRELKLVRLEPVEAPVGELLRPDPRRPEFVVVVAPDGRPFAEGTYELRATLADGAVRYWYLEVGPGAADIPPAGGTH
ncbi:MAG TPA: hypothetical protein VFK38_00725 [Candidatus Limnocylindrales bacterium]|nr:hypothetical protein [Candidatus Limnocylindrales bacterium]